jgi:hypothetical protein
MQQCLIDSAHVPIVGGKDQFADRRGCEVFPSGASTESQVSLLQIFFTSIPLDLPGRWYIGATAFQQPAKYAKGTRTEKVVPTELMEFGPTSTNYSGSNGYEISMFGFSSYIIIATPEKTPVWDVRGYNARAYTQIPPAKIARGQPLRGNCRQRK